MSDFKDYSLPELYRTGGQGPPNPGEINWMAVGIYCGIAVLSAMTMALIINNGLSRNINQILERTSQTTERLLSEIERKEGQIKRLNVQLTAATECAKAISEQLQDSITT